MQWVENLWLQQIGRFLADQANEPMQVTTLKADKKLKFPSISSIVNIITFNSKIVISKLFKKNGTTLAQNVLGSAHFF